MYTSLEEEIVNDDIWSCIVVMLAEAYAEYGSHIQNFKTYNGNRPVIKVVTSKDVDNMVMELKEREIQVTSKSSNLSEASVIRSDSESVSTIERSSKMKSVLKKESKVPSKSQIQELNSDSEYKKNRHMSQQVHGSSIGIGELETTKITALAIKQYILEVRKKELEKKQEDANENQFGETEDEMSDKSAKKSPGKKEKTLEEIIHDEPECGPSIYFVLVGFYNHKLIPQLIDLNVPLLAAVCYGEENLENIIEKCKGFLKPNFDKYREIASKPFTAQEKSKLPNLFRFWLELFEIIINARYTNELNDFTIVCFQPTSLQTKGIHLKANEKGRIIYNDVAEVLFELVKHYRRYIHYFNTSNEVNCPLSKQVLAEEFIIYKQMIELVPLEYITVEYILHCIIEQVVENEGDKLTTPDLPCGMHTKIQDHYCEPFIINNKNKIKKSSFNIVPDICEISLNLYSNMPYCKLTDYLNGDILESTKIKFQLNFILKWLKEMAVNAEKLELLIHQILFTQMYYKICSLQKEVALEEKKEQLDYSILKQSSSAESINGVSNQNTLDTPTDINEVIDLQTKRENDLLKLKKFLDCEELTNLKNYFIEDNEFLCYTHIEDLKKNELLQSLQRAINKYKTMYFLPVFGTNSVLALFHNDFNEFGLFSSSIEGTLRTPVGFRDYYLYIRHIIKDWLHSQEELIESLDLQRRMDVRGDYNDNETSMMEIIPYPMPNKITGNDINVYNSGYNLYNVCNYFVNTQERITTFYSTEGVVLDVKQMKGTNMDTYLSFILQSFATTITYHYFLNGSDNLFSEDLHFNITTKNGTIITCIQKLVKEISDPTGYEYDANEVKPKQSMFIPSGLVTNETPGSSPTTVQYDFDIALPTGLKIEVRCDKDYIKQYYLAGNNIAEELKHEEYRTYSRNGTVIVFFKNGMILILYANGTRVRINEIIKQTITIEENEPEIVFRAPSKIQTLKSKQDKAYVEVKKRTEKEIYVVLDVEIFGWTGEYTRIAYDIISDFKYLHKMRVAHGEKEIIIKNTDGTVSMFNDKSSLTVIYPIGTLINSEINTSDITYINPYEEESVDPNATGDIEKNVQDYRKTLMSYVIPAYKKLSPDCRLKQIKSIKYFFLYSFFKSAFSKNEPTDLEKEIIASIIEEKLNTDNKWENDTMKNDTMENDTMENDEDVLFENLNVQYHVQHPLFANIQYKDNDDNWFIELPDNTCVIAGKTDNFVMTHSTSILIKNREVNIFSNKSNENSINTTISSLHLRNNFIIPEDIWISEDSVGRTFIVNSVGEMDFFVKDNPNPPKFTPKQTKLYKRFYVIKNDLTGCEYIHFRDNNRAKRKYDINEGSKYVWSRKQRASSNKYSGYTLTIFKNKTDLFKMQIENPFNSSMITRKHLGDCFPEPKKWIFDTPLLMGILETEIIEPLRKPLAIIYRNVKNISHNNEATYTKLLKALTKMEAIREFLYKKYENHTVYCKHPISNQALAREFSEIIHLIGTANAKEGEKN